MKKNISNNKKDNPEVVHSEIVSYNPSGKRSSKEIFEVHKKLAKFYFGRLFLEKSTIEILKCLLVPFLFSNLFLFFFFCAGTNLESLNQTIFLDDMKSFLLYFHKKKISYKYITIFFTLNV